MGESSRIRGRSGLRSSGDGRRTESAGSVLSATSGRPGFVAPAPNAEAAPAPLEHGGDLSAARRRFPDAPETWIDLSTGINPHTYPVGALPEECFARLPEPATLLALEESAARAYGVADARAIVATPGAQALIQMLPRVLPGRRVGILGPTYAEHAASWRRAGRDVVACADASELADCDVAVIVNPNNPRQVFAGLAGSIVRV